MRITIKKQARCEQPTPVSQNGKWVTCLELLIFTEHGDWRLLAPGETRLHAGRTRMANVFKVCPGVKKQVGNRIMSVTDAWRLFIDESILRTVLNCSNTDVFRPSLAELESFIGLQYARGIYGRNHSVEFLWSKKYGANLFRETMSRKRFCELKKNIRFNMKVGRKRRQDDPFSLMRDVFEMFTHNCRNTYRPNFSLTIDEQLMPLKNRCRLITYMPNKPDKYGIKFWFNVDNTTKYVYNMIPYVGACERQSRDGRPLATDVVFRLMQGLLHKGYNVTTDNFFTSPLLASSLLQCGTTTVGTMRCNRRGVPEMFKVASINQFDSVFYWNSSAQQLLVKYQSKKNKSVALLSTLHNNAAIDNTIKKKPTVVKFYNKEKCGVDIVDNMLRMYSCRCASRRWTMAVWQNMLDVAALNSWICYKQATGINVSRKHFVIQLVDELCKRPFLSDTDIVDTPFTRHTQAKCTTLRCRNMGRIVCYKCRSNLCGPCCSETAPKIRLSLCRICQPATS